jgi:DNA polymerase-3 subunit beta
MFKAEKSALAAALAAVIPVVKAKNTMPILQNVLIERDGDQLMARGSNMDMEIAARFDAVILPEFEPFTCPGHLFNDFVKNAPETTVTVDATTGDTGLQSVRFKSGRASLKQPVLPAIAFPKIEAGSLKHGINIAGETLADAIEAVAYAAETDTTRPYICGVLLEGVSDGLNVVATDGKRIARRMIRANAFDEGVDLAELPRITLPSSIISAIVKALRDAEDVTLELSALKVRLVAGSVVLTAKLLDSNFPDWNGYVKAGTNIATVGNKALQDALGRALIATPETGNGVLFTFGDDGLTLTASDNMGGEGEDAIDAEIDKPLTIGLNGKHLRDALAHTTGETIEILLDDPSSPVVMRPQGDPVNLTMLLSMKVKGVFA